MHFTARPWPPLSAATELTGIKVSPQGGLGAFPDLLWTCAEPLSCTQPAPYKHMAFQVPRGISEIFKLSLVFLLKFSLACGMPCYYSRLTRLECCIIVTIFSFFFLTNTFKEKVVNTEKVLNQVKETQPLGVGFS